MPTTELELVANLYAAFGHNDLDAVRAALAPDVVTEQSSALPWAGRYVGPDGFFDFINTLYGYLETRLHVEEIYVAGGSFVQVGRSVGRVRANNAHFDAREVHVVTVRDGRIARFQVLVDTTEMLAAVNGDPSTDSLAID